MLVGWLWVGWIAICSYGIKQDLVQGFFSSILTRPNDIDMHVGVAGINQIDGLWYYTIQLTDVRLGSSLESGRSVWCGTATSGVVVHNKEHFIHPVTFSCVEANSTIERTRAGNTFLLCCVSWILQGIPVWKASGGVSFVSNIVNVSLLRQELKLLICIPKYVFYVSFSFNVWSC